MDESMERQIMHRLNTSMSAIIQQVNMSLTSILQVTIENAENLEESFAKMIISMMARTPIV